MRYISQRWDIDLFARVVQIALYVVMEYVPGGSLTQKLKEPFSTAAAAFYSAQIALALIHLHDLGVLYRYCASLALFPRCILHHGLLGKFSYGALYSQWAFYCIIQTFCVNFRVELSKVLVTVLCIIFVGSLVKCLSVIAVCRIFVCSLVKCRKPTAAPPITKTSICCNPDQKKGVCFRPTGT